MLKKTITFNDLDGNPVTEDFYFNLSKSEIAELELSQEGGLSGHLHRIISAEKPNGALIMTTFKDIIARSVGRRSEDGRRFIKNQEITDEFLQTEAYDELFMELVTDAEKSANFIEAIMPASLVEEGATLLPAGMAAIEDVPLPQDTANASTVPTIDDKFKDPSWVPNKQDLMAMTPEQLQRAFERKSTSI